MAFASVQTGHESRRKRTHVGWLAWIHAITDSSLNESHCRHPYVIHRSLFLRLLVDTAPTIFLHLLDITQGLPLILYAIQRALQPFQAGKSQSIWYLAITYISQADCSICNTNNPFSIQLYLLPQLFCMYLKVFWCWIVKIPQELYNKMVRLGLLDPNHIIGEWFGQTFLSGTNCICPIVWSIHSKQWDAVYMEYKLVTVYHRGPLKPATLSSMHRLRKLDGRPRSMTMAMLFYTLANIIPFSSKLKMSNLQDMRQL